MQISIGIILGIIIGFIIAIIYMVWTGFGQDYYLTKEIEDKTNIVKKISDFADNLINNNIMALNEIEEILDITTLSAEEKKQHIKIITDIHIKKLYQYLSEINKIKVLSTRKKENCR